MVVVVVDEEKGEEEEDKNDTHMHTCSFSPSSVCVCRLAIIEGHKERFFTCNYENFWHCFQQNYMSYISIKLKITSPPTSVLSSEVLTDIVSWDMFTVIFLVIMLNDES